MSATIISRGVVFCKSPAEPLVLEGGFNPQEQYLFERCKDKNGEYFRVFPLIYDSTKPLDFSPPFYYECFRKGLFSRHFNITTEEAVLT